MTSFSFRLEDQGEIGYFNKSDLDRYFKSGNQPAMFRSMEPEGLKSLNLNEVVLALLTSKQEIAFASQPDLKDWGSRNISIVKEGSGEVVSGTTREMTNEESKQFSEMSRLMREAVKTEAPHEAEKEKDIERQVEEPQSQRFVTKKIKDAERDLDASATHMRELGQTAKREATIERVAKQEKEHERALSEGVEESIERKLEADKENINK
jgi:hypothetical protein